MSACNRAILKEIKVIASLAGVQVDNALTFENNSLQFRGALVRDTDVWGNFALTFGTSVDRVRDFNVRSNHQTYLEYSNGVTGNSLMFNSAGITLNNTLLGAKGLEGGADFSPNYTDLTYIQKVYADTHLLGKAVSPILQSPTPAQNSFALIWDSVNNRFDLGPSGGIIAGSDTQVIYNSGGSLVGSPNMTFATNIFTAPNINIGSTSPLPGTDRNINVISDVSNTGLIIKPKGTGNLRLSLLQGSLIVGDTTSVNTIQLIKADGVATDIDIGLEPKGVSGKVYIGNGSEAGATRFIKARGNAVNISLILESKGNSTLILNPSPDDGLIGSVVIGRGVNFTPGTSIKRLYADSDYSRTDLEIGGNSTTSRLHIGTSLENASDRYILPGSSASNAHLHLNGKGTGRVFVNGVTTVKIAIGDWDMDSFATRVLLPDIGGNYDEKILSVAVKINEDASPTNQWDLNYEGNGGVHWLSGVLYLERKDGGMFDSSNFNATGYNRGYVYITYEE